MPRIARALADVGFAYHVICRGNNKQNVFLDAVDFSVYKGILFAAKKRFDFDIFHFVLMSNHVHLLLSPRKPILISEIMKFVSQSYSLHFKKRYGYIGHIWQDRFKQYAVIDDAYLLTAGIYIELNPVRAAMVVQPEHYLYSSSRKYLDGLRDPLVTSSPAYLSLSNTETARVIAYKSLVKMWIAMKNPRPEKVAALTRGS